jgi:hypothetical protein
MDRSAASSRPVDASPTRTPPMNFASLSAANL